MPSARLSISLQGPVAASLDLLMIEQQDWSAFTGVVTSGAMVRALRAMLYGDEYQDTLECGVVGGNVVCVIDVYPRQLGMRYRFAASHGILSDRSESEELIEETVNFSLANSVAPSYPPLAIHSAEWADVVYDGQGNEISPPRLTIKDGAITCPVAVYGSVDITYMTERHSYTLTIPRREDAVDQWYSAVIYGWYEGGINWLVMEMPPGIEVFEADPDTVCGHSVSASVTDDEPDPYEQPVTANRTSIVNYCDQAIVEDRYV